jgi:formylglycine-generating enzyme required for sulfatase activity
MASTTPAAACALLTLAVVSAPPAHAAGETLDWVRVGDPGNRAPNEQEAPFLLDELRFGAVDYEFEITETPVTVGEWLPFVQAYAPYAASTGPHFRSSWIIPRQGQYEIADEAFGHFPVNVSLVYAARFVNWLHNGKSNEPWAFESGVYDTSDWREDPGQYPDDWGITFDVSPNARYRLPHANELTKALYYDPDRYGPDQGGYWMYPDGGDEPLIQGLPEDGGETNAGMGLNIETVYYLPVGSYPHVRSPYGLTDVSGGERELTFTEVPGDGGHSTFAMGTSLFSDYSDLLAATYWAPAVWGGTNTIRLVRPVPEPPVISVLACIAFKQRRGRVPR